MPKKKIHTVSDNWIVYELVETGDLSVTHFCTGEREESEVLQNTFKIRKISGFNRTVGWDSKKPTCEMCKENVPESITMLVELSNTKI
jgi:hypothetical protein